MEKISYAGYRFPPEIVHQARWLYLRFTLSLRDVEDLLAERGLAVSYETVRRWVNHFGPMIVADLRKRRLKPHTAWHLDKVYLKIDGRMVYLWRAVDAEGEVLDVLVQSKRNRRAALKLMRKLLKKYASFPSGWSPTTCDHTAPRSETLGSSASMSAGNGVEWTTDELLSDPRQTLECLASRQGKSERSIRMTLSLAFLAPKIVIRSSPRSGRTSNLVLVDNPPVLPVTDAMVLSTYAEPSLAACRGRPMATGSSSFASESAVTRPRKRRARRILAGAILS